MNPMILRCPQKPIGSSSQEWDSDQLMFEWSISPGTWQKGSVDQVPFAEEVIALLPSLDIRLMEVRTPQVHDSKLKTILPSLIEEDILSPLSQNEIQLLPPISNQTSEHRTVAIIDASWFQWIYEQLAKLLSNKIKLIPEFFAIPLVSSETQVFFSENTAQRIFTYRTDLLKAVSWMQPKNLASSLSPLLPQGFLTQPLSDTIIQNGIQEIDDGLLSINLLPPRFYQLRKKTKKQIYDWSSLDLWASPIKWASLCLCIFVLSKLAYLSYLAWVDQQWQHKLASSMRSVSGSIVSDSLKNFPVIACQIARKNGLQCNGEFHPMIAQLDNLLQALPPDSLIGINYSQEGLIFEVAPNVDLKLLKSNPAHKDLMIQRINATQFILRPYSGLGVETK